MNHIIAAILTLLAGAIVLLFAASHYNQTQADRVMAEARAESMVIRAQAEADASRAAAQAGLILSIVPLMIVGGGIVITVIFLTLAGLIAVRVYSGSGQRVIERQVIYVLPAGASRREVWNVLAQTDKQPLVIEGTKELTR